MLSAPSFRVLAALAFASYPLAAARIARAEPTSTVPRLGSGLPFSVPDDELESLNPTYRLGSEWGKHPVTEADLSSPQLARAAKATARVGGATGFYLGKFAGKHIVATNHHVCPDAGSCRGSVQFELLGQRARIMQYLGTWTDIDLSLLVVDIPQGDVEAQFAEVAGNFDFDAELTPGRRLITIGYGIADNQARALVANQDSDCKVFSNEGDYRLMADPDALNPGPYRAWSFANGCDVSHGDSGSAMVDRETGSVVGIIWTGKIPKARRVQDTAYLDALLSSGGDEIWTELSYAVPASKIGEYFARFATDEAYSAEVRAVFAALAE